MRGLTREERHQWHGQPGNWTCKRCYARLTGGCLDDGICPASMSGRLDYSGTAASPTRLDTPETVNESVRQRGLGELLRSTGKGLQVVSEQGGKR